MNAIKLKNIKINSSMTAKRTKEKIKKKNPENEENKKIS